MCNFDPFSCVFSDHSELEGSSVVMPYVRSGHSEHEGSSVVIPCVR